MNEQEDMYQESKQSTKYQTLKSISRSNVAERGSASVTKSQHPFIAIRAMVVIVAIIAMMLMGACKDSRINEPVGTAATAVEKSEGSASASSSNATASVSSSASSSASEVELADNPIDFAALQAVNVDVYAWLYIPNTNVNYAICQSSTNYLYYLDHNSDGEYSGAGAIYSEAPNSLDFSDPVTVIYGHDAYNGEMFSTLHDFEDVDFFNANEYFYIYTPGHILTYQIVSAYQYDDRHILNSFNFYDESVRLDYFDFVQHPTDIIQNVRQGITLTADSKLVQLSTCMTSDTDTGTRYIVSGVLIDDQPTK